MSSQHIFVLLIVLVSVGGWVMVNAIRMQVRRAENGEDLEAARKIELLAGENGRLKEQIGRLEERVAVLERIATDDATRLGKEIDALR